MNIFSQKELHSSGTISFPWDEMVADYLSKYKLNEQPVVNVRFPLPKTKATEEEIALRTFNDKAIDGSGNMLLDMYCLEGMKLFNQGPFASNIKPKSEDGL